MVIIGCATAFTKILTIEKIPGAITNGIINFTDNKILILLLINVLLLIVGCFMDTTPAMMVLAPILLPIAAQFGVDPLWHRNGCQPGNRIHYTTSWNQPIRCIEGWTE